MGLVAQIMSLFKSRQQQYPDDLLAELNIAFFQDANNEVIMDLNLDIKDYSDNVALSIGFLISELYKSDLAMYVAQKLDERTDIPDEFRQKAVQFILTSNNKENKEDKPVVRPSNVFKVE